MTSRQVGHFFFEPKGYDEVNQLTHERKEEIKVGYNLRRKIVLLSIWGVVADRAAGAADAVRPARGARRLAEAWLQNLAKVWLALGGAGLAVPHRAAVLRPRRADRPRVGDEDPHRSVPRREALPPRAAVSAARASSSTRCCT